MRIWILIAVFLSSYGNRTLAQAEITLDTGYIVLNSHDTLKGWIYRYPDLGNYRHIQIQIGKAVTTYFPYQVLEYKVGDTIYSSRKIRVKISGRTVFLKLLYKNDSVAFYEYRYINLRKTRYRRISEQAVYIENPEFTFTVNCELYFVLDPKKKTRLSKGRYKRRASKIFIGNERLENIAKRRFFKFKEMNWMIQEHGKWLDQRKGKE